MNSFLLVFFFFHQSLHIYWSFSWLFVIELSPTTIMLNCLIWIRRSLMWSSLPFVPFILYLGSSCLYWSHSSSNDWSFARVRYKAFCLSTASFSALATSLFVHPFDLILSFAYLIISNNVVWVIMLMVTLSLVLYEGLQLRGITGLISGAMHIQLLEELYKHFLVGPLVWVYERHHSNLPWAFEYYHLQFLHLQSYQYLTDCS